MSRTKAGAKHITTLSRSPSTGTLPSQIHQCPSAKAILRASITACKYLIRELARESALQGKGRYSVLGLVMPPSGLLSPKLLDKVVICFAPAFVLLMLMFLQGIPFETGRALQPRSHQPLDTAWLTGVPIHRYCLFCSNRLVRKRMLVYQQYLRRLRLRHRSRGSGIRSSKSRLRIFASKGSPQRFGARKTPLPHHYSWDSHRPDRQGIEGSIWVYGRIYGMLMGPKVILHVLT